MEALPIGEACPALLHRTRSADRRVQRCCTEHAVQTGAYSVAAQLDSQPNPYQVQNQEGRHQIAGYKVLNTKTCEVADGRAGSTLCKH